MRDRGLLPSFSEAALDQVRVLQLAADTDPANQGAAIRDLRALLWSSIDNDDSRDLDQLTVAEARRATWCGCASRSPTSMRW